MGYFLACRHRQGLSACFCISMCFVCLFVCLFLLAMCLSLDLSPLGFTSCFCLFSFYFCSHLFTRQSRDQLLKVFIPGLLAFSSLSLWSSVSVIQHVGISLLVSARFWTFLIFFLVCFAVSCLSHVFLACLMSRIPGVICPIFFSVFLHWIF